MTTIAFDGVTLAADRMWTFGGMKFQGDKLVHGTETGRAIAFSAYGNTQQGRSALSDALSNPLITDNEYIGKHWTEIGFSEDKQIQALLLLSDGRAFWLSHEHFEPIPTSFMSPNGKSVFALGSGAHFAIGAMMAGANAVGAIEIASRCHEGTGMGLDFISVNELAAL